MRKIRWPEKMATSIDCPSFWYPVISYPGTVVSYPSLSRSVPKFESFRTQVWVVAYPIRWSIHTDINRCVRQISRVKRVRYKEKSVLYTCDLLDKNNIIIAWRKVSVIFLVEKSIVFTCHFFNNNSSCQCDIFSPIANLENILY